MQVLWKFWIKFKLLVRNLDWFVVVFAGMFVVMIAAQSTRYEMCGRGQISIFTLIGLLSVAWLVSSSLLRGAVGWS